MIKCSAYFGDLCPLNGLVNKHYSIQIYHVYGPISFKFANYECITKTNTGGASIYQR